MDHRIEPEVPADVPEVKKDELKNLAQWNAVEVLEFCSKMLQTCGDSQDFFCRCFLILFDQLDGYICRSTSATHF